MLEKIRKNTLRNYEKKWKNTVRKYGKKWINVIKIGRNKREERKRKEEAREKTSMTKVLGKIIRTCMYRWTYIVKQERTQGGTETR